MDYKFSIYFRLPGAERYNRQLNLADEIE